MSSNTCRRWVAIASLMTCIVIWQQPGRAQRGPVPPVPTWPDSGVPAPEYDSHYVFLSSDRHFIIVRLPPAEGSLERRVVRVPVRNASAPSLKVEIASGEGSTLVYRYELRNAQAARDPIGVFSLVIPAEDLSCYVEDPPAPNGKWGGVAAQTVIAKQPVFPTHPEGRYLTWFHQGPALNPGQTLSGFAVRSGYRPGLTTAWFGSGELVEFDQSWPDEVFSELLLLEDRQWRGTQLITAGPVYPPEASRDSILAGFRSQLADLVKSGLCDPQSEFIRSLDGILSGSAFVTPEALDRLRPQSEIEKQILMALKASLRSP
jgi:hypothetical protein